MDRKAVVEMPAAEEVRLPISVRIGASSFGLRLTLSALPAARNELNQRTSGRSDSTWLKTRMMPMPRTPRMRPFSPGLCMKAVCAWRNRMDAMNPTMTRNSTIVHRKGIGLDSL